VNRINLQPRKGGIVVHLGKDFWWIVKLFGLIVKMLVELGKTENEDTPDGQV